jgi:hypothetical protein
VKEVKICPGQACNPIVVFTLSTSRSEFFAWGSSHIKKILLNTFLNVHFLHIQSGVEQRCLLSNNPSLKYFKYFKNKFYVNTKAFWREMLINSNFTCPCSPSQVQYSMSSFKIKGIVLSVNW